MQPRRAIQGFVLGAIFLAIGLVVAFAVAYAITDGQIVELARVALLHLQLREHQSELFAPYGKGEGAIRFTIRPGADAAAIASSLFDASLIRDKQLFLDYARVEGLDRKFEAGVYFLNETLSIAEIAPLLTDSSSSHILFRTVEGARIEEIAALIDSNGLFGFTGDEFLGTVQAGADLPSDFAGWAGIPAGASLEGFLFPDTYQLPPDISPIALRGFLLDTFRDRAGDQLRADALAQGFTMHQIVTLASIVEREAVWREEHDDIAGVYRNRLAINMKLEADPTVQYGLQGSRDGWWPNITRADYRQVMSPYNTYLFGGLPPGPIASPGLSAIQAAIYPAESNFYYFRAACDNSHFHNFAVTFDEHVANGC
ncbi:MAG: endolytic transglycosylase MltG [Chloroflexi bacterium]|nr:endolytic transglycosylase MltG [Chloroflexota bacterium]